MLYSGKETQTLSNGHQNGALSTQTYNGDGDAAADMAEDHANDESTPETPLSPVSPAPNVYYNARLDPKNFLEGPLSLNPATRLRQMLARPGIVVCLSPYQNMFI